MNEVHKNGGRGIIYWVWENDVGIERVITDKDVDSEDVREDNGVT